MNIIFWKVLAWLSIACGLLAYGVGWLGVLSKTTFWGIPNEFLFYDAIATGIFGLFFLIYSAHYGKK